jgi:exo-beta-1,3-glucanase (GH17 family)
MGKHFRRPRSHMGMLILGHISVDLLFLQFGFDGGNQWMSRRDSLFQTLHSNPKAKFVTRVVQFGSEPLFDHVLDPADLASQVNQAKAALSDVQIPVTVSDMAYGYQSNGGAQDVLDAIDSVNAHMLPFFSADASTGK